MRTYTNALVTLTALVALSGCGKTAPINAVPQQSRTVAAHGLFDEGPIVFDKDLTNKTIDLLGVGPTYESLLADVGIKKVKELLLAGASPTDRKHLAADTGISPKLILTWVNHSDLMRVTGVGPEYARLLERAGVDSVMELANRNSINLAKSLRAANDLGGGKVAVKRIPDVTTTTKWVDNANEFARIVTY